MPAVLLCLSLCPHYTDTPISARLPHTGVSNAYLFFILSNYKWIVNAVRQVCLSGLYAASGS